MLLDALDDPPRHGAAWLRHGGLETLLSFGMQGLPRGPAELADMAADLRRRMGAAMLEWLRARPLSWQSGNVVAVHAGLDPRKGLAQQNRESLLWGHPAFGQGPRRDGLFVVHGHSIVPQARISQGRLMLDTGAYATGTLSFSVMDSGRADIYSLRSD
jgi:serine/threonine protein phosphatase 1